MKTTFKVYHLSFIIFFFITCFLIINSCKREKKTKAKTGLTYYIYRENKGPKPEVGDWVTVEMVYKDDLDSILFDSRKVGKPMRFAVRPSPFIGSFEEGLTYLSEGDSVTFFVSADSMYEHVFLKNIMDPSKVKRPTPGSFLKFDVSLLKIQPYKEAEMEIAMNESRMEKEEMDKLEKYLKEKNITAEKQPEGYYIIAKSQGNGPTIKTGDSVQVNYTARFLNGSVFNSSSKNGKPYSFKVGNREVIAGWDIAFQKLHRGDKATLIIPSRLAYGADGIKKHSGMDYIVPPFSTLIVEVEILNQHILP